MNTSDIVQTESEIIRKLRGKVPKPMLAFILSQAGKKERGGTKSFIDLPSEAEARSTLESFSPRPEPCFSRFRFENPASCDLSIIIPVYNTERFVGECLDSVLAQETSFSMEVIVVNDGSTDSSPALIQERASRDGRVCLIHQENKGFSGARNTGIDVSRGRVLCFVDSDDMLAPGHLSALWNALVKTNHQEFVSGLHTQIDEEGRILHRGKGPRTHGGPGARLFWREQWSDIRFPQNFLFEDTVIGYCIQTRFTETSSNDVGYLYRLNSSSISRTHHTNPKSLDTYWVTEEMLDWCQKLRIPLEKTYRQTIQQFGPVLWDRTSMFNEHQRRALFSCSCALLERYYGDLRNAGALPSFEGRREFLERSLWNRDYTLWRKACKWRC